MAMTESTWNGFRRIDFDFEGREVIVVFADEANRTEKWMLKTEYFDAFPETEIALMKRGYNLVYLKNLHRLGKEEDYDKKFALSKFLKEEYGFSEKCVCVGMSCGGLHAVHLAARYPEMIACLYLDAPVMNLLSWPLRLGNPARTAEEKIHGTMEFYEATGMTISEAICFRDHPMDRMPALLRNNIPVILVSGDSDMTVRYEENGARLEKYYKENGGIIEVHIKPGGDHHPHGLPDCKPIVDFIEKYY
ncbi:MAG: alpha/beta hydrolase [Clostridia bacterium]|nr:alpha/beta hydrolase [Clostridia bacterium]